MSQLLDSTTSANLVPKIERFLVLSLNQQRG